MLPVWRARGWREDGLATGAAPQSLSLIVCLRREKNHGEVAFLSVGGINRLIHANKLCIRTTHSGISIAVTIIVYILFLIIVAAIVVVVVLAVVSVAVISRWR